MRRCAAVLVLLAGCSSAVSATTTQPSSTTSSSTTSTSSSTTSTTSTTTSTTSTTTTVAPTTTLPAPPPLEREPTETELAVLDAFAQQAAQLIAGKRLHGVGLAIAHHDTGIGVRVDAVRADGQPVENDAPFRLASVSKLLTSIVVLQLDEDGVLDLDDRLGDVWPSDLPPGDPRTADVTVRQLLQHTSGFGVMRDLFFGANAPDWRTAAAFALRAPLQAAPGTDYRYSNANYVVLGSLIEALTGGTFDDAVRERVLEPLDIESAALMSATAPPDPAGPAYAVNPARRYIEALGPAGSWQMAPADVARLVAALQPDSARHLLTAGSLAEMRRVTTVPDDEPNFDYGLGLMVFPIGYGHTGTIEDVRAFALALPNGYSVTVLAAGERVANGEALIEAFAGPLLVLSSLPMQP